MRNKMSLILAIILTLMLIAYEVIAQMITVGFTDEVIKSANFWNSLVSSIVSNLSAWYVFANTTLQYKLITDATYKAKKEDVESFILNELKADFDVFLVQYNNKRKKELYLHKIHRKLHRLERWASQKSLNIYVNGTEEEKKLNKYCRKRLFLEFICTEEYIDKNLATLKVKYRPYTRLQIVNIYSMQEHYKDDFESAAKYTLTKGLSKVVLTISCMTFLYSVVPNFKDITPDVIISIVMSITFLILNAFFGAIHGHREVDDVYIYNLTLRQQIFDLYTNYRNNN